MVDARLLSSLLEVLYATPFQPERWGEFLSLLCVHTGSRGAYLMGADQNRSLSIQMQGGFLVDAKVAEEYSARFAAVDPYKLPVVRAGRVGFFLGPEMLAQEEYEQTEMFLIQNKPLDLIYPATLVLECSLQRLSVVSVWRSAEQGPMPEEHRELFEMLQPHVGAVLEVRKRLGAIQERIVGLEAMVDSSSTPTLLLTAAGKLLHGNESGHALLEAGDALFLHEETVRAADTAAQAALKKMLAEANQAAQDGQSRARPFVLPRKGGGQALQLLLMPLNKKKTEPGRLILLASDPERPARMPAGAMKEYYGLTKAESEIVDGLLTGYSVEEIAILRKTSKGTARGQLKAIFAKTGTRGQTHLMQVLMSMPAVRDEAGQAGQSKA